MLLSAESPNKFDFNDKGRKNVKNVKKIILSTCENTIFASITFMSKTIQNIPFTNGFKKEFFPVGHQTP